MGRMARRNMRISEVNSGYGSLIKR